VKRLFLILVFVRGLCSAQLVDPPEVAALPAWPADGKLPPSLEKKHIFHDLATGEIVVSYPSPAEPGHRTTFRFWLPNRVEPVISVEVAATEPKLYSYTYTLHNGPNAQTPIRSWSVVGPPNDPQLQISHPEWRGVNGQSLAAPQAMVPGVSNGAHLFWSNWTDSLGIGGTAKGFQLVSSYRPGLSTAYAMGDGVLKVPADLTDEVEQELPPFQRAQIWSRPALTIGPRFPPSMSRGEIASHFRDELLAVIGMGALDGRSAYFRELIAGLANSIASGIEPKVNAQPRPGMEREVAQAVHVALSPDGAGSVR
jgi:hypothetical protein